MRHSTFIIGYAALVLVWGALVHEAEAAQTCVGCRQPITGEFFWFSSPALKDKQPICRPCSQLDTRCFACDLPVKAVYRTLADGRRLCEWCDNSAVHDEVVAQRVFELAKRDVIALFSGLGNVPGRSITMRLVGTPDLARIQAQQETTHDKSRTFGLTRTLKRGAQPMEHTIYLASGLPKARFTAVAAHELTHAWLHENVKSGRDLEGHTIEAFCELAAYLVMDRQGHAQEKDFILANNYTQGRIKTFVTAEREYRFHRIAAWMKEGADKQIDPNDLARVLSVDREAPTGPLLTVAARTRVPDTLTLKGISGTANRRFALVNDQTLALHEQAKVRVGDTNVLVKCLDIRKQSVLLQVEGEPKPVELFFGAGR